MGARWRVARWQLGLFVTQSDDREPEIPEAVTAELVAVIAELLLEGAGAREGGVGGGDESEDHA